MLADQTWTSLDEAAWLLVPVGSTEQHGSHLPLRTDTIIAEAVATRAAHRLAGPGRSVLVGPAVEYGASGEHQDFAGTTSIGREALQLLLLELGRSALTWADRLVLVNGHGGNVEAIRGAVTQLRHEGRRVAWTSCTFVGGDAHAGDTETSLMLHLAPRLVGDDRSPGATAPVAELMADLRAHGVRAVSATGVLGDPGTATAERGGLLLEQVVSDVVAQVQRMAPDASGRLR